MNKITLSLAALAALLMVGLDGPSAQAAHGFGGFGIHLGGRNVHLDIGNPHGRHYQPQRQVTYRRSYSNPRWYGSSAGHYDYHDTSHYDYHPGGYVRHGNHLDYQRGHYDFHQQGHYDRHHGGHH